MLVSIAVTVIGRSTGPRRSRINSTACCPRRWGRQPRKRANTDLRAAFSRRNPSGAQVAGRESQLLAEFVADGHLPLAGHPAHVPSHEAPLLLGYYLQPPIGPPQAQQL